MRNPISSKLPSSINPQDVKSWAEEFGTPLYVIRQQRLHQQANKLQTALRDSTPYLICYALKANPTLAVIQTFARLGFGADVTSGGELIRALNAGVPANKIVFSGVGKTDEELARAIVAEIKGIHVESVDELIRLIKLATGRPQTVPIGLRVNPAVDPDTHPHIATGQATSKFGLGWDEIPSTIELIQSASNLRLAGIAAHIGSQITNVDDYRQTAQKLSELFQQLVQKGLKPAYIDTGGGLGVAYRNDDNSLNIEQWGTLIQETVGTLVDQVIVEPGRMLVAEAGYMITRVLAIQKRTQKNIIIVDAGMNDLLRPMLYDAYHPIWPLKTSEHISQTFYDIAGPVCESTDVLATQRQLPKNIQPGDLLVIGHTGAYGSSMASNYNSRLRAAEVMIDVSGKVHLIRKRDTYQDLTGNELKLP